MDGEAKDYNRKFVEVLWKLLVSTIDRKAGNSELHYHHEHYAITSVSCEQPESAATFQGSQKTHTDDIIAFDFE